MCKTTYHSVSKNSQNGQYTNNPAPKHLRGFSNHDRGLFRWHIVTQEKFMCCPHLVESSHYKVCVMIYSYDAVKTSALCALVYSTQMAYDMKFRHKHKVSSFDVCHWPSIPWIRKKHFYVFVKDNAVVLIVFQIIVHVRFNLKKHTFEGFLFPGDIFGYIVFCLGHWSWSHVGLIISFPSHIM